MINRRLAIASLAFAPLTSRAQQKSERERAEEERIHNDWPNLTRYRDANRQLAPGAAQIVFMGDSITEGWSDKAPMLFKAGRLNRGIGGQTTPKCSCVSVRT